MTAQEKTSKLGFYEVGSGKKDSFYYDDQKPIGPLLDTYFRCGQVRRENVKIEFWDYEVQKTDTLRGLQQKHGF